MDGIVDPEFPLAPAPSQPAKKPKQSSTTGATSKRPKPSLKKRQVPKKKSSVAKIEALQRRACLEAEETLSLLALPRCRAKTERIDRRCAGRHACVRH